MATDTLIYLVESFRDSEHVTVGLALDLAVAIELCDNYGSGSWVTACLLTDGAWATPPEHRPDPVHYRSDL